MITKDQSDPLTIPNHSTSWATDRRVSRLFRVLEFLCILTWCIGSGIALGKLYYNEPGAFLLSAACAGIGAALFLLLHLRSLRC